MDHQYDLWKLKVVAEIRAGINTRNVAVSSDGQYVMVANTRPIPGGAVRQGPVPLVKVIPVVAERQDSSSVSAAL
ncbi:MAG: hypothetical protein IPN00_15090 [Hydrogenophilales bacterium]|nr:hypothetical protein [Hydrogenophilales bacterium]